MRPFLLLFSLIISLLMAVPAPATARLDDFAPCADATSFPALEGSQCLTVSAPLDPGSGGGDEVQLFVRKFPVADPTRRRGEVWLVAGGPGEPGASFYPLLDVFRRAFPNYDLVVPDHRGTGQSARLCPVEEAADSPAGVRLAAEEWGPCIRSLHADPARAHAFTVSNAARDLSGLIAHHRGGGELLVYAVSYGTQLALRMMQVAPPELDGLILDGLVPPEGVARWELSYRTALVDRVGRATLSRGQERAYRRLLGREDPPWKDAVPGGDLRRFMGSLLNFPQLRARIPMLVSALSRGDTSLITRARNDLQTALEAMSGFPQSAPSLPLVMLISGSENNSRRDLTAETVEAEAADALFTSPLPGFLVDPPLPLYTRDRWFGHLPPRLPRTLVIHGTLDPNTPYEGASSHVRMLRAVGDVTFATVEEGAHLLPLVAPKCFVATVSRFVSRRYVQPRCRQEG
jgi:pimeloyl-ACP methyl ester carboxylesterase